MTDLARDLERLLDPTEMMVGAGMEPDEWQAAALRSDAKRQIWLCCRQSGKSTVAAAKVLHTALYQPGSLVLLLSPSLRQSQEVFRKVVDNYKRLSGVPDPSAESALRLEFPNGSRVISMPASDATVRGYSNVALLVIDEAAHCSDGFIAAVLPSTVSNPDARILMLSTPNLREGMFWRIWGGDAGWEKTSITWRDSPRVSEEAVEMFRRVAGDFLYRREFLCQFTESESQLFAQELIDACFTDKVTSLDHLLAI